MINQQLQHNYQRKLLALAAAGKLPDIRSNGIRIHIYHDDGCGYYKGGFCDCDPDIVLEVLNPAVRRTGLD